MRYPSSHVRIDVDFSGIAAELRERATTGAIDERRRDMEYVYACSRRVPETATLCFTRCIRTDTRSRGWPADPACRGQLHLSLRCASRVERDAWVHAILGADVSTSRSMNVLHGAFGVTSATLRTRGVGPTREVVEPTELAATVIDELERLARSIRHDSSSGATPPRWLMLQRDPFVRGADRCWSILTGAGIHESRSLR